MELVAAWLRQDLNAAIAEVFVLGREGVLVDPDLANRVLWRKAAAAEAINIDLAASARHRLHLQLHGGIIGREDVELFPLEHERTFVL